jgi:FkbH-like protein
MAMEKIKIAILNGATYFDIETALADSLKTYDLDVYCVRYEEFFSKNQLARFKQFNPDIVWINTTSRNIIGKCVNNFMTTLKNLWKFLEDLECLVIQNNFENCKHSVSASQIDEINTLIRHTRFYPMDSFLVCDLNDLSSRVGLNDWYDERFWYSFKIPYRKKYVSKVADKVSHLILRTKGKIKKCLVLDLDNTLWGGVIGDDDLHGIKIGRDDPEGEAYNDFQKYCKTLSDNGVLLAVCSKNEFDIAKSGFTHPDSVLRFDDFVAFEANWNAKHLNLINISEQLNIDLDSFVFVDDNPVERELVKKYLPQVAVPNIGSSVVDYMSAIEEGEYFSLEQVTPDDKKRKQFYKDNFKRTQLEKKIDNYDEFLKFLEMKAEIREFERLYFARISQLSKRTNQFNLTTNRCEISDIENFAESDHHITLYGKLKDKFGDNGLVSALVGKHAADKLEIDLWIMSCRVFQRDFELAMFDELIKRCKERNINEIVGKYKKTDKNRFVKHLYKNLGFCQIKTLDGETVWHYNIPEDMELKNKHTEVNCEHLQET